VASLGSLLLIAILGSVALGVFSRALERQLSHVTPTAAVRSAVLAARGGLVMPAMPASLAEPQRYQARAIVAGALVETVQGALCIGAGLALASALVAAFTIPPRRPPRASAPF
jgi:hypothetical protein